VRTSHIHARTNDVRAAHCVCDLRRRDLRLGVLIEEKDVVRSLFGV